MSMFLEEEQWKHDGKCEKCKRRKHCKAKCRARIRKETKDE